MKNESYSAFIQAAASPHDVFNLVTDIPKWWTKDVEGQTTKLNDEFIIRHGDVHYSKQKLIEVIPDKKLAWLVTDCRLNWLEKNKTEWTNTKMIFEITPKGKMTTLKFTHEGLVPQLECYSRVVKSWDIVIREQLYNLMINGSRESTI